MFGGQQNKDLGKKMMVSSLPMIQSTKEKTFCKEGWAVGGGDFFVKNFKAWRERGRDKGGENHWTETKP